MKAYKGYSPSIWFEEEDQAFHGTVEGARDLIHFTATSAAGLIEEFHASVDDYLEFAAEEGFAPDKPYSGKLALRTSPEHHRLISEAAAREQRSINQWIDETLSEAAKKILAESTVKLGLR